MSAVTPLSPAEVLALAKPVLDAVAHLPAEHQVAALQGALGAAEAAVSARARLYMMGSILGKMR